MSGNTKKYSKKLPKVYKIKSVGEFIDLTFSFSLDGRKLFRGQTKEKPLIPSIGRDELSNSHLIKSEKDVFLEFKRESIPHLKKQPSTDIQYLAVAQHNGLPTRLLDWTQNPLVALWFAVNKPAINNNSGIVWVYLYEENDVLNDNFIDPFKITKTYVFFPDFISPLIQAQSGVFILHHKLENSFIPFETQKNSDLILRKIEISPDLFPILRYQLFSVGIGSSLLFPGLEGISQKIKYKNVLGEDET
jgi:hypothetical protein